jgi:hypothetical protein
MARATILWMSLLAGGLLVGCVRPVPPPGRVVPGALTRQLVDQRVSAVMVAARESIQDWADQRFPKMYSKEDVDDPVSDFPVESATSMNFTYLTLR